MPTGPVLALASQIAECLHELEGAAVAAAGGAKAHFIGVSSKMICTSTTIVSLQPSSAGLIFERSWRIRARTVGAILTPPSGLS